YLAKGNTTSYTPSVNFNPATKKYVDDGDALKVDKTTTVNGQPLSSNVTITKSDVGLGNVPNVDATNPANISQEATHRFVTDAEKPVSTAQATALGLKADKVTSGGTNGHFAALTFDGNLADSGRQPSDYLSKNNTTSYSPTLDYHPATKKYVDDHAGSIVPNG